MSDFNLNTEYYLTHAPNDQLTSGQHTPLYELLKPYNSFPQQIKGPTLWDTTDFTNTKHEWTYTLTKEEVQELSDAADSYLSDGSSLPPITKDDFKLETFGERLHLIRNELLNGKGFFLLRGLPITEWTRLKIATVYLGLGTHIGNIICQNGLGHIMGHVADLREDSSRTDRVRAYRTSDRIAFHTDYCDIVGLLPLQHVEEGGLDELVSTHYVWNILQREYPDMAKLMTQPIWYFDRKGELSCGQCEWTRQPIFYLEPGGKGRVYCKLDPSFVTSLSRFSNKGLIPPLTEDQVQALDIFEELCKKYSTQVKVEVGDIQWTSNSHIMHARTAYVDPPPPAPSRHLLRLWLATPESEGGWTLPMPDNDCPRRGGVQVNGTKPRVRLSPE